MLSATPRSDSTYVPMTYREWTPNDFEIGEKKGIGAFGSSMFLEVIQ